MTTVQAKVKFDTISDVKEFVSINNKYDFEIDVQSDRYRTDGKSILGMFSLDLSCEVNVVVKIDNVNSKNIYGDKLLDSYIKDISKFIKCDEK